MNSLPAKKSVTRSSFASAGGGFVAVAKVHVEQADAVASAGRDRRASSVGSRR